MSNQLRSNKSRGASLRIRTGLRVGYSEYSTTPGSYYPAQAGQPAPKVYWWSCQSCRGDRVDPSTLKKAHCEVCNYS